MKGITNEKFLMAMVGVLVAIASGAAETRSLNGAWKFWRDPTAKADASSVDHDDAFWKVVTVPHDWAISGPFNPKAGGWQGKLPLRGVGWYRRTLELSSADVRFVLEGPGEIVAVGNGNPKDHKSFTDVSHHPLHYGKAVVVVRRLGSGRLVLNASVDGLAEGRIELK